MLCYKKKKLTRMHIMPPMLEQWGRVCAITSNNVLQDCIARPLCRYHKTINTLFLISILHLGTDLFSTLEQFP